MKFSYNNTIEYITPDQSPCRCVLRNNKSYYNRKETIEVNHRRFRWKRKLLNKRIRATFFLDSCELDSGP